MMTMEIHDNLAVFGENECIYQCVLDDFKNAKFIGIITFNISSSTNSQLVLQNTGAKTAELILYALLIRLGFFHFLTSFLCESRCCFSLSFKECKTCPFGNSEIKKS